MRYKKTVSVNGTETARYDYVYSDGTLILLTHTANGIANTARFVYDSFGEPRGFILNNEKVYLYLKNGQGDITAIVDENGEILVRYEYNAWGAVEFIVPFGVDPAVTSILATVSPFTYRGYCYDYDIGMYYLQSRYYDPEICRFINADSTDYLGATGTVLSYNLFAYCENDGVNYVDSTGEIRYTLKSSYLTKRANNFTWCFQVSIKLKQFVNRIEAKGYLYGILGIIACFIPEPLASKCLGVVSGVASIAYGLASKALSYTKISKKVIYITFCLKGTIQTVTRYFAFYKNNKLSYRYNYKYKTVYIKSMGVNVHVGNS